MTDRQDDGGLMSAVDRLLLGGEPRYTREEVLARCGLPEPLVRGLWRAMGFPESPGAAIFTDADLTALQIVGSLRSEHLIDDTLAITLARSLGQTTARLADWQVEALGRNLVDAGVLRPGSGGIVDDDGAQGLIVSRTAKLLPALEELLSYAWRRQVAAVMERRLARLDEVETADVSTVVFADLVGFTRLARQLEDEDLAAVVEGFEELSADVVAECGGHLVKTVGDEILFTAEDPATAVRTAFALHAQAHRRPEIPELRVGMATGSVLRRMGDVFGSVVNLASRLTALARPGTTLVDARTARALSAHAGVAIRQTAPRRVRGVGVIRSFELSPAG